MATCSYCGKTILFGGKKSGNMTFCSADHLQKGGVLVAAQQVPSDLVEAEAARVHAGQCAKCNGPGPVDIRKSYSVASFLIMTNWRTNTILGCRGCGRMENLKSGLVSALVGWWGIPWGLIMTPVQIIKNISAAFSSDEGAGPSMDLKQAIRVHMAQRMPSSPAAIPSAPIPSAPSSVRVAPKL